MCTTWQGECDERASDRAVCSGKGESVYTLNDSAGLEAHHLAKYASRLTDFVTWLIWSFSELVICFGQFGLLS